MSKTNQGIKGPSVWSTKELVAFSEEESSMEEEWMRDRALLWDLLNKDPQTAKAVKMSVKSALSP